MRAGEAQPGSASTPQTSEACALRPLHLLLGLWARTRGPLFDDPCAAAARIVSYVACLELCEGARDPFVRASAADTLIAHTIREPSKDPAVPRNRQKTYELLGRISKARAPDAKAVYGAISSLLPQRCITRRASRWGWAVVICGALPGNEERLRLRCARTLLRLTYLKARKIGYGKARPSSATRLSGKSAAATEGPQGPEPSGGSFPKTHEDVAAERPLAAPP